MTDAPLPPDDEIVSAHLDGAATAEEAARVDADPALRARAAELARVAAAVAAPVEVPATVREAALAAALDAFDRPLVGETTPAGPAPAPMPVVPTAGSGPGSGPGAAPDAPRAPVTDLAAARARRRGRAVPYLVAAAAAVVLVVAGLGVARRGTTSTDTASVAAAPSTTTRADSGATNQGVDSSTEKSTSGAAGSPTTTTARSGAPSTVAPSAPTAGSDPEEATGTFVGDLGTFTSPTQVRAALDRAAARSSAATGSGSGAVDAVDRVAAAPDIARCDAVVRTADPEIGPLRTSGTATYQGTDALVLVYGIDRQAHPAANGATRAVTVDRATCVVLDAQTF